MTSAKKKRKDVIKQNQSQHEQDEAALSEGIEEQTCRKEPYVFE